MSAPWDVQITQDGRAGSVTYCEPEGTLSFWWEFGGADAVVMIAVGTPEEWATRHSWAAPRRATILQRVVDEVIRQRAEGCSGEVDDSGWINIYRTGERPPARERDVASPERASAPSALKNPSRNDARAEAAARYFAASDRRARIVGISGLIILALALMAWLGRSALQIRTTGAPSGSSMRAGATIVTLTIRLEPYIPSLHRNPDNDRFTVGLLLHDAASGERRTIELARGRTATQLGVARLAAAEGAVVWANVPETMRVDLATGRVSASDDVERDTSLAPPRRPRSMAELAGGERIVLSHLAAGGVVAGNRWLGIHEPAEIPGSYREGFRAREAVSFERSSAARRMYTGRLSSDGRTLRFGALQQMGDTEYFNAALVRAGIDAALLELVGGGRLMLHDTKPRRAGTIVVSRLDDTGTIVWQHDTGIGELTDILPDTAWPAFVGTRPRIPDKVPEPILVVVDAGSGRLTTHSLWLKD